MNLDDKIKQALEKELPDVEQILVQEEGLFDMLFATFKSNMRGWVIAVNVVIVMVTVLMFWTGYEFFTAANADDSIFWGICLVLSLNGQIALKQWIWSEMRRSSMMREIKRLELAIARLQ